MLRDKKAFSTRFFNFLSAHPLILVIFSLVLLSLLVYSHTLNAPFLYDDTLNITRSLPLRINSLTPEVLMPIFKSQGCRPLASLSFALNYYMHGNEVWGYHAVNLVIHIFTSLLVFLIARQTLRFSDVNSSLTAFLAAALWSINPVHIQSVTYTVQRMNSLAAFFYLLSMFCYIKARLKKSGHNHVLKVLLYGVCLVSGLFSLASKEIGATLPLMLFLYEWYFFKNLDFTWLKKKLLWIIPAALLIAGLAFVYLGDNPFEKILAGYQKQDFTLSQRLLTEPAVVIYYICLLIFPHPDRLALIYDFPVFSSIVNPPTALIGFIGVLGLVLAGGLLSNKQRLISFAVFWFLGNLVIESSIIGLALVFEHRTYLPSVFPFIALTSVAMQTSRQRVQAIVVFCFLFFIILCGIWTFQRNTIWDNVVAFWQDNADKAPNNPEVNNNLGQALLTQEAFIQAIKSLKQALKHAPEMEAAKVNLGMALQQLGHTGQAVTQYRKVLNVNPANTDARFNLAMLLKKQGHTAAAKAHLEKIIRFAPHNTVVLLNLGVLLMEEQKNGQALTWLKQAAALDSSDARVLNNLGIVLHRLGRTEEAITAFQQGLALESHNPQLNNSLGLVLMDLGRYKQAEAYFQQSLAADPDLAEACNNLGLVNGRQGNDEQAADYYRRALMISPSYNLARYNLALLLVRTGQVVSADGLLAEITTVKPEHWPVLNQLIIALAEKQVLMQATTLAEKVAVAMPENEQIHYNLSCLYARQRNTEKALLNLGKAVDLGYHRWEYMKTDPDLENIRHTGYYKHLIKKHNEI